MNQLTKLFSYQGNQVTFRNAEGTAYVNATQMAKSFNKRPAKYLELPSTKELIEACIRKSDTSENQFIVTKMGSSENGGGTWLHETIALDFAQWLSVDFKLWCNDRIKELLTVGMTATPQTIENLLDNPDMIIQMATQLKELRSANDIAKAQVEEQKKKIEQKDQALIESREIIAKAMPKVAYCEAVLQSKTNITTNIIAQELGITAIRLNQILKEKGIHYKQGSKWLLVSKLRSKGYTETYTHTYLKSSGEKGTDIQTRWTELGRAFIHHLFKN